MERASRDVAGVPKARESGSPPVEPPRPVEPEPVAEDALTERELAVLDFEKQWWRHAGAKEQGIRDTFGLSPTRYYQLLNGLLERPAALAHDPVLVKRLRRVRASRVRRRT
jgi:hypothetical protein